MDETNELRSVVSHLREDYQRDTLSEATAGDDPLLLFEIWLREAVESGQREPNAMTVATCTPDARPSARVVLLRSFDEHGFVFFTNYDSRKGHEIEANPYAALVFYWAEMERQVRISGHVERVSREESDEYFRTRPHASQLGAWASAQSSVLADRHILESRLQDLERQYAGQSIPLPPFWGGYRVKPDEIEFWQGRRSRLHDRLLYTRDGDGWQRVRLSP